MLRFTALSLKHFSKRSAFFCTLFFLTGISATFHAQTHAFSGLIGKYPVYIQFTLEGSKTEGYYFYKNKLIDISLSGTYKSGVITLKSMDEYGNPGEEPEIFQFKWPVNAPEGTWSRKAKSLPLKLTPLTAKETGSPKCSNTHLLKFAPVRNPLSKVKIGLFKLKEIDSLRIVNGMKVRNFREVNTGIELFRIDSGLVAAKLKDANSYLEFLHISEFLESLSCAEYSSYGAEYGYNIGNLTLSSDFISFSVFETYYCGGAHPNEDNFGVNYNLNTRERISTSDFIDPGKESAYEDRIYSYFTKTQPEYFGEPASSDEYDVNVECDYSKKELWTTECNFSFTSEGIKFMPSFAHFNAFCMDPEWAVIPYSELKDLIEPEFYNKLIRLKQ